jgi:hypothetical protein
VDNILSCVWSNHLPHAHLFFSSPKRQHQQQFRRIIQESLKYSLKIVANTVNSGQLIIQGNPDVYLLNAKEDSTDEDFRWVDMMGRQIRIDLSPPPYDHRDKKILLLMGAAGNGKEYPYQRMINYIRAFQWKDSLSASTKTI